MKTFSSALPRGFALFLGAFGILNVVGGWRHAGFDANLWWLDLRWLAAPLSTALVLVASCVLVAFGIAPPQTRWRRWLTVACAGGLLVVTLGNCFTYYLLLARKDIGSAFPIPFSLLLAVAVGSILMAVLKLESSRGVNILAMGRANVIEPARVQRRSTSIGKSGWALLTVGGICLVLFPLLQMFCFGKTNYVRSADVAVVLGARVYKDGRPSDALADRVRTACRLYREGLTKKLIFSGGPGDGAIHETESMRRMAIQLGVKSEDIFLDKNGLNTQATVKNTLAMLADVKHPRVLVVSHFYHLPRIKLAYQREGLDVYTVPARESYLLGQLPYNMAREVAAFWVYYLRPLNA